MARQHTLAQMRPRTKPLAERARVFGPHKPDATTPSRPACRRGEAADGRQQNDLKHWMDPISSSVIQLNSGSV